MDDNAAVIYIKAVVNNPGKLGDPIHTRLGKALMFFGEYSESTPSIGVSGKIQKGDILIEWERVEIEGDTNSG